MRFFFVHPSLMWKYFKIVLQAFFWYFLLPFKKFSCPEVQFILLGTGFLSIKACPLGLANIACMVSEHKQTEMKEQVEGELVREEEGEGEPQDERVAMALGLPEVVGAVLRRVRKEDLGKALLVCRSWRREGEKPSLWAWVRLKVHWPPPLAPQSAPPPPPLLPHLLYLFPHLLLHLLHFLLHLLHLFSHLHTPLLHLFPHLLVIGLLPYSTICLLNLFYLPVFHLAVRGSHTSRTCSTCSSRPTPSTWSRWPGPWGCAGSPG